MSKDQSKMKPDEREGSVYIDLEEDHRYRSGSPAYRGMRAVNPTAVARELASLGRAPTPPVSRFRPTRARKKRESGAPLPEVGGDVGEMERRREHDSHGPPIKRRLIGGQENSREKRSRTMDFFERAGFMRESSTPAPNPAPT